MEQEQACYCGSGLMYRECCSRFLVDRLQPNTAEELMRSRYTAYVLANAKYIIDTTHPKTRHFHSKNAVLRWSKDNNWQELQVVTSGENSVVFKAIFIDKDGNRQEHIENSLFEKMAGKWYYVSGTFLD
ncbi:YchJ family protein [Myroides pelagicus]|uniref:YchJ-like middle NTF2-like domain-containing protein n=1 Tax=Myroides pelagicus TaxID=270914 RepID=A0A7K1GNB9_9FLAO|nr:YchJ family metal-binding protein [Myroides pelagicus]MEC4112713.1 YchJ family metal-binding protein [Myroides pelagicus]MTH29694.1 hypothetical protein [Myroides pelagicus]